MLRRRFLGAMGATGAAALGALAGCLDIDDSGTATAAGGVEYPEVDHFALDWVPKQLIKSIDYQAAFTNDQIFFRFEWEQPDPGGWYHDYIVYEDGEWSQYLSPDPWVSNEDNPDHKGFYEDRVTFLLDDGSVKGFENFGGWLTVHMGVRSLPGAATAEEVEAHPLLGNEGYGRNDIRKFIPQSRAGEWWENPWDDIEYDDDSMLDEREMWLDLPMFRAHRSNPMGYATDHHVTDYRHGDEGSNTFGTQGWDEETGPEYMYDPAVIDDGALDIDGLRDSEYPQDLFYEDRDEWMGEEDPYYIHEDWLVEFDPDIAEWEGAAIPRRPLQEPSGSAGDWRCHGIWEDGKWKVEMWRDLQTDNPRDTKQLDAGGVYDFAPAIHHGFNARWHWVAYPYKLGLGEGTDADFRAASVAASFGQAAPHDRNWGDVPEYTIPLIYPGQADWTWLCSSEHRGYIPTRNDEMSIWDVHENPRRMTAMLIGQEVGEDPRGEIL